MTRYNIALLPKSKTLDFIAHAKQIASGEDIDYLLGKKSLPHITLAQFKTDDVQVLARIWPSISNNLVHLQPTGLQLHLSGPTWSHDRKRPGWIWLQLLPDNEVVLYHLHVKVLDLLKKHNLTATNRSLNDFEPHMTLMHTRNTECIQLLKNCAFEIADTFFLALGKSDDIGQFLQIIDK